jgi:hypothetical protein
MYALYLKRENGFPEMKDHDRNGSNKSCKGELGKFQRGSKKFLGCYDLICNIH